MFVTGLEEGLFPHENSRDEFDGVEEERRLMYVAVTRAKRRLYVTHAQSRMLHGQVRYNIASRFLAELPREIVVTGFRRANRRARHRDRHRPGGMGRARRGDPAGGRRARGGARAGTTAITGWRIGQSVRHAKFGVGIIIDAEGRGGDSRVQVNFRDAGVKWLALEYAKLEAA